jgi:hypothetical protein
VQTPRLVRLDDAREWQALAALGELLAPLVDATAEPTGPPAGP